MYSQPALVRVLFFLQFIIKFIHHCKVDELGILLYNKIVMEDEKVLLVDFMYLWNRIYYAIGQNQGGDYYAHMLGIMEKININSDYNKKYIVLDGINGTQRQKELLSSYKEGRAPKAEVYAKINQFVRECTTNYVNLNFVRANNHEADEVIASLAIKFSKKNKKVFIYSGDKDLLQLLVYPNISVGMKYTGNFQLQPFSEDELKKKMDTISNGVLTEVGDILKFRVFRGDASDKIPPAIPRFPSKIIKELIDNVWKGVTSFNDDIFADMVLYLYNNNKEKYSKQLVESFDDVSRNWELMQLQFVPYREIIKEVVKLN